MTNQKRQPNRRPASRHIQVIDNLLAVIERSAVTRVTVAQLIGVHYITLDKYLRKERNVKDLEIVRRMVATTELLNEMVDASKLPISQDVNPRLRTTIMLETIDQYVKGK